MVSLSAKHLNVRHDPSKLSGKWIERQPAAVRAIYQRVRGIEHDVGRAYGLPGRRHSGTATGVAHMLATLGQAGHQFEATILDNATLRVHLLNDARKVGRGFTMPLDVGGYISGMPEYIRDQTRTGLLPEVSRSKFITRGRGWMEDVSGKQVFRTRSFGQTLTRSVMGEMGKATGTVGVAEMVSMEENIQRMINQGVAEDAIWVGRTKAPLHPDLAESVMYGRGGSLMDVFQAGGVSVRQGPGIEAGRYISGPGDFPLEFKAGQLALTDKASLKTVGDFLTLERQLQREGVRISTGALKDEAVLHSMMSLYGKGDIVPFGAHAVRHQMYQRLGITKVRGAPGAPSRPTVSTPMVEAMKREAEKNFGANWGQWTAEGRVALVMDTGFEQATGASAGGAIVTRNFADQLAGDITQQVDMESRAVSKILEKTPVGTRAIQPVGVGSTLITSGGTKHTIASVQQMKGAQMAIGFQEFVGGKHPEAIREAIIRDLMDRVGPYKRGWYEGDAKSKVFKRYSEETYRELTGAKSQFLHRVKETLGGGTRLTTTGQRGVYGLQPQMLIGPRAQLGRRELRSIQDHMNQYNAHIKTLKNVEVGKNVDLLQDFFEEGEFTIGEGRDARAFKAIFMTQSVMNRLEQQSLVTKAAGRGDVGFAGSRYHSRGTKLRPKDIVSLRGWHTAEANALADEYTRYAKGYMRTAKKELAKTVLPFTSGAPLPGLEGIMGFPDMPGAVGMKDLKRYMEAPFGGKGIGVEHLTESIFAETSPLRKKGVAVQLPSDWDALTISGLFGDKGELIEGIQTKQVYLPGLEMYRGVRAGAKDIYIDKLLKSHERFYMALSAVNPSRTTVDKASRSYYKNLGLALQGKSGLLSYLSTARMAHSGYLGLVPGGTGATAAAIGTALESPSVVDISQSTARQMGVYDAFKRADDIAGADKLYGRLTAYPSIGPTTENAYLFRMVQDSDLGSRQLRLSNAVALSMFRDFDADKSAVTFFLDRKAQKLSKAFYEKNVRSNVAAYDSLIDTMSEDNVAVKKMLSDARAGSDEMRYSNILDVAYTKAASGAHGRQARLAEKYLTKQLTPAINWYMQQFRDLSTIPGVLEATSPKNRQLVNVALGAIEQQVAIVKGGQISPTARQAFSALSGTYVTAEAEEAAVRNLSTFLGEMPSLKPVDAAQGMTEDFIKGMGIQTRRDQVSRGIIEIAKIRQRELLQADKAGSIPSLRTLFTKVKGEEAPFLSVVRAITGFSERTAQGRMPHWTAAETPIMDAIGMGKQMGFQMGHSVADMTAAAKSVATTGKEIEALNSALKQAGSRGPTVLDRVTGWFSRADTPYWQKAGVITAGALVAGAVAKSILFGSSYGPDSPPPGPPSQVYVPPPQVYASPPIPDSSGPMAPQPHRMHRKPGGLWAYVSSQAGRSDSYYDAEPGQKMAQAVPNFGRRIMLPGMGLDLGPAIADSRSRPMILAGPAIGGGAPLPPAMPAAPVSVDGGAPPMMQAQEPTARVSLPDHMRFGGSVEARSPVDPNTDGLMELASEGGFGNTVSMDIMDDPMESSIDRWQAMGEQEFSSFT